MPVPICGRCQTTISRRELILAGLLVAGGAAAGVIAVRSRVPHDVAVGALFTTIHWVGGLFLGGLAGLFLFVLAVSPFLEPVKIRPNGWIVFRNRWYREEFRRMNDAEFKRLHGG